MKRLLSIVAVLIIGLVAVVVLRALPAGEAGGAATQAWMPTERDAAVARLAGTMRIPAISYDGGAEERRDDDAFLALHGHLERSYPRVHRTLRREIVSELTLLYTWSGSRPELDPIILMAHLDVVPPDPAALDRWTHPPFDGTVADGFLWGRGAIDDKGSLVAQLEAVEALLAEGYAPERTVLLSFGHDEELGGDDGAGAVVEVLKRRGVRAALVLDEGGAVVRGGMPGIERPLALVGIAEKGFVSVELRVEAPGGHSSFPPPQTTVGILAAAITALDANPLPSRSSGIMVESLTAVGPHMDFGYRLLMRNFWLFRPLVERFLSSNPATAPMLRTTTAATIFQAGIKDNVLPTEARAVVNFRIMPGDSIASVAGHVRRVVDDERVVLTLLDKQREPSGVTSTEGEAWSLLRKTIREILPDAVPAPYLVFGGTDSRHFREISDGVLSFAPLRAHVEDFRRAHGNDERVAVDSFLEAIGFYAALVRNASATP